MQAALAPLADSEFPPDWADTVVQPAAPERVRPQPHWAVWIEFVLFCLGPALGFCLAQCW